MENSCSFGAAYLEAAEDAPSFGGLRLWADCPISMDFEECQAYVAEGPTVASFQAWRTLDPKDTW